MSHKPPVPGNAVSPYPLKAKQMAERETAKHDLAEKAAIAAPPAADGLGKAIAVAAVIVLAALGILWGMRGGSGHVSRAAGR